MKHVDLLKLPSRQYWLWLGFGLIILIADQVTKQWVASVFELRQVLPVFPSFNLTLAHNYGAAFSFLANQSGWQKYFFLTLSSLIALGLTIWLLKLKFHERKTGWWLVLIISGALGNIIDRASYGYVIDFLDVYVGNYHWPAFNVADSAIVVGAIGLIFFTSLGAKNESN